MKRHLHRTTWLAVVLAICVAFRATAEDVKTAAEPAAKKPAGNLPALKPRPLVTISKETTYITGPLRENGYPDYVAALNELCSKGVTPENNAVVLLCQAMNPDEIGQSIRERFFKMLGIPPPPETGRYYVSFFKFTHADEGADAPGADPAREKKRDQLMKQYDVAMERPWSRDELPAVFAWLEANEKPLELIVAATRRPRFYAPLLGSGENAMVIAVLLPVALDSREAARALKARAMLRIKSGNTDGAHEDLLACHRLGRLVSQGPTLVELLVGIAINGIACYGDAAVAHYGNLSVEQARRFAEDMRQLPPMGSVKDKVNVAERFMFLDCACVVARAGPAELALLFGISSEPKAALRTLTRLAGHMFVDWDEPLRMGNAWYDRFIDALSKPTRNERRAALDKIDVDIKNLASEVKDARAIVGSLLSRKVAGQQMGRVLVALLLPAVQAVVAAEDRSTGCEGMVQTAYALAAYRAEHKSYPTELAQLVPKHLKAIPEDPFSGGPLRYKREADGYLLYMVGLNGKDDGGRTYDDAPAEGVTQPGDDVTFRMPVKKK